MSAFLLLQYAVIALAVLVSVAVVAKKQFPNATRRLRIACALPLVRADKPGWLRALGRQIAPPASLNAASACGGCDSCDTPSQRS